MKDILFSIIVIILTPIYLLLCFLIKFIDIISDMTESFIDLASSLFEEMKFFWKKVFKGGK